MSTIPPEKIERNRNTPNGRKSTGNMKPFWFRAAQVSNVGVPVRLGAIAAVMLSVGAAFGGAGGWLSPSRLTQDRMMTAFEDANGTHAGFRRNHAKGVCVTGWFESNGQAAVQSKAAVFRAQCHETWGDGSTSP
jgi:catalase